MKALVTFFRKSELRKLLNRQIVQGSATRWGSCYQMYLSVYGRCFNCSYPTSTAEGRDDIRQILSDYQHGSNLARYTSINFDLLKHIVDVLRPFTIKMDRWQSASRPTLHLIVSDWAELTENLLVDVRRPEAINCFTMHLHGEMKRKCPVEMVTDFQVVFMLQIHYLAMLLFPNRRKALQPLNPGVNSTRLIPHATKEDVRHQLLVEMRKVSY